MMISSKQKLNDKEFLAQFEDQMLDVSHFNHTGHLRVAWLYLNGYEVETAVKLVCSGIQAFANNLRASRKFHLTITDALVRIIWFIDAIGQKRSQLPPDAATS